MTWIIDTVSKRRLSARLAAGIAISAILAFGTFAGSARAGETGGGYYHYYNGGYYSAPPVVYGSPYGGAYYGSPYYNGSPYYYAPPVVYGPSVGVSLPFIGIGIR
jgi:hypothetical protein